MQVLIVMGVSGVGKSTVARGLAEALGGEFIEGDAFHPPANVAKMAAGQPLTDADRQPWLDKLAEQVRQGCGLAQAASGSRSPTIIACSALKRSYRQQLDCPGCVRFVYLKAPAALIDQRLHRRQGHFATASLLASQLATLEEPAADAITVDASLPPEQIIETVLQRLES